MREQETSTSVGLVCAGTGFLGRDIRNPPRELLGLEYSIHDTIALEECGRESFVLRDYAAVLRSSCPPLRASRSPTLREYYLETARGQPRALSVSVYIPHLV